MNYLILHTNDFHNRLTDQKAQRLQHIQNKLTDQLLLLLDAGDAISSGNVDFHPQGEPILDRMSVCGYDAMTMGNREFHFTQFGLKCKIGHARFPVLCANLYFKDQSPLSATVDDYFTAASRPLPAAITKKTREGLTVLVVGLTVPMITSKMMSRHLSAYLFEQPLKAAVALIPLLQNGVKPDLTIALTHIGIAKDRELAQNVPSIDLIIGGHTHELLPQGEWVGNTLIVQAGCYARYLGCVEWDTSRPRGDRKRFTAWLEAL